MLLAVNSKAPAFSLPDENGVIHTLDEFKGHKVVLYFYPKDNTGGCTTQGLGFKELFEAFQKENAVVIGVSKDSVTSHQKFKDKYAFPFMLLSDEKMETINAYGAYGEKVMCGKKGMGVIRTTYILDENGVILSGEAKVSAKENPACALKFVQDHK